MVNSRTQRLDDAFFALSDPTRRQILSGLAVGEMTVAELASPFEISAPAISKHLRVLEKAGLIEQQRVGKTRKCKLNPEPLKEVADCIEFYRQFWEDQFDQLAEFLDTQKNKVNQQNKKRSHRNKRNSTED